MELITDLVVANRILATEDVVDAYGHVSARNPDAPERFFLAHSKSPSLVEADDIVEHTLDGQALKKESRPLYLERFIHAAIYEARPEVMAVVHAHAEDVLPFTITKPARSSAPRCPSGISPIASASLRTFSSRISPRAAISPSAWARTTWP